MNCKNCKDCKYYRSWYYGKIKRECLWTMKDLKTIKSYECINYGKKRFNNIVIHNYNSESFMKVIVNFRSGNKIVLTSTFADLETTYDFLKRKQFENIKRKVINHKGEM